MKGILTYHSIDESRSVISIDRETFERHVRWLASGAVRVTTVEELLRLPAEESGIALTFDDAFENFAAVAWPLLREHGLPATVFVVSAHAGRTNAWGGRPEPGLPELPLMDWDTLARLAEEGLEIGSHTASHRRLTGLDPERCRAELVESRRAIQENTGVDPRGFAYPYGAFDGRSREAAAREYEWVCTTELELLDEDVSHELLPRLDMYHYRTAGRLEAWGSSAFSNHLWLRGQARGPRSAIASK